MAREQKGFVYKEFEKWIDEHRNEILDKLRGLVAIKSVSAPDDSPYPFGKGVNDVLEKMLELGKENLLETENYESYLGSIEWHVGGDETNTIGIWAHLDVVPEGSSDEWKYPPYEMTEDNGWIYGRGVADNKNAAVGALYILKGLRESGYVPKHNLKLYLGTNEEVGMKDISFYREKYSTPFVSIVPDSGFPGSSGEFGRLEFDLISQNKLSDRFLELQGGTVSNVVPGESSTDIKILNEDEKAAVKGVLEKKDNISISWTNDVAHIVATGKQSHAAIPQMGVNANKILTDAILQLPFLDQNDRNIFEFISNVNKDVFGTFLGIDGEDEISGQTVSGGNVLSLSDGYIHLVNDCRFNVSDSSPRLTENIRKIASENSFNAEFNSVKEPSFVDQDSPILGILKNAYQDYTGEEATFPIGKGGTYAGKLPNAIATGICKRKYTDFPEGIKPGHGSVHQPDECMSVEGYFEGIKLLAFLLTELDKAL